MQLQFKPSMQPSYAHHIDITRELNKRELNELIASHKAVMFQWLSVNSDISENHTAKLLISRCYDIIVTRDTISLQNFKLYHLDAKTFWVSLINHFSNK